MALALTVEEMWKRNIFVFGQFETPYGAQSLILDKDALFEEFATDREAMFCRMENVTIDEYRAWIAADGKSLCGALTKKGLPCKNAVGPFAMDVHEWAQRHRNEFCAAHR